MKWTISSKGTVCQNAHKKYTMNRPIPVKEIESIINNLPKQKVPGPFWFTDEFYQILKKKLYPFSTISFRG